MNVSEQRRLLGIQLQENTRLLAQSMAALRYSIEKCRNIGIRETYDLEQQESFEALTSRFARTADILTQKAFKTWFQLLQENVRTFIDAAHLAEKLELVDDAEILIIIRELRNQIAHEYVHTDLSELYRDVLRYGSELERIVEAFQEQVQKL